MIPRSRDALTRAYAQIPHAKAGKVKRGIHGGPARCRSHIPKKVGMFENAKV